MSNNPPRGRGGGGRGGRGDFAPRGGRGDFNRGGGRGNDFAPRGRGRGNEFQHRGRGPSGPGHPSAMAIRGGPSSGGRGGPRTVAPGIYLANTAPAQPDPKITALENKMLAATKGKAVLADPTTSFPGFPGRSSYGDKGKAIVLRTNYFNLQFAYDIGKPALEKTLYRYDVVFEDDKLPRAKRRRALEQLLATATFQGIYCATDFANIIVTTEKLTDAPQNKGEKGKEHKIVLPANGSASVPEDLDDNAPEHVQSARARNTVRLRLEYSGAFNVRDLVAFLNSTSAGAHYDGYQQLTQMLNIIMCKAPNEAASVAKLPGNKFYPHHGLLGVNNHPDIDYLDLAGGLVALRGYFSSVRPATGRMLININVTSGAFYQTVPLLDLLAKFGNHDLDQREMFIRKLKVLYERPGKTPIKAEKTIAGFARTPDAKGKKASPFTVKRFGNAREVTFGFSDRTGSNAQERKTTVFDYFKGLGVTLKSPELPVLNVGAVADPVYIPMEMCTVLPGQPYRKLLSGDQTSEMLKFAARVPNQNAMSIAGDKDTVGTGLKLFKLRGPSGTTPQSDSIEPFGINASTDMLTVPGRILMAPPVKYGKKQIVRTNNGSWNCADQAFIKGGNFPSWATVVFNLPGRTTLSRNPDDDDTVINTLTEYLKNYGLTMGTKRPTRHMQLSHLTMPNRGANNQALNTLFSKAEANQIALLFLVLPSDDKWLYARVKSFADTCYGIHTICSIGSKLSKPQGQGMYMGNLALKFNIKGGGINHVVDQTLINPIDVNTMLMGIDVTHPSPGSAKGAPSIACAVANKDKDMCQWPGSLRKQRGKQEMIDEGKSQMGDVVSALEEMVVERLECWRKFNNQTLPKKILVYRDGVSEGQYALVLRQELPHFHAAFEKLYGPEKNWPKMAVIVVGKRHHTRFYATKVEDADYNPQRQKGSLNTKPGTVVDRHITGNLYHEFYLQAHQGLQGTARPAHYVVIKDDIGFDANSLEQITHHLCYMFGRATKAVSIVPPAYYADLLAERGRAYLYNTLQENHRDDSTTASGGSPEWDGKIHPRLKDSFFYI